MAKMFYTLEEASEKLGLDAEQIKEMAAEGKLQQFRDRDKLMFKREQVDGLTGVSDLSGSDSGIELADPGPDDTDAISLVEGTQFGGSKTGDSMSGTGISVFEADEIDSADPLAQTHVSSAGIDDEELALESVGSGSGLLDLTRESDDTSLGAELLDEIYPGGGDTGTGASIADFGMESSIGSSIGSSGVFEGALSMDTGASGASGLDNLASDDPGSMDLPGDSAAGMVVSPVEATYAAPAAGFDPVGSAMGAGLLIGAIAALLTTLVVMVAATMDSRSVLLDMLVSANSSMNVLYLCLGLAVLSAVLGFVGMTLARKSA